MTSSPRQPRLAARAVVVRERRILLVNATPHKGDGKWCTPGGGTEAGADLRINLKREVREETGLEVEVGDLVAVHEFFDSPCDFHQVDLFFRASVENAAFPEGWQDAARVVEHRGFFTLSQIQDMDVYPRFLRDGFWLEESAPDAVYRGVEERQGYVKL